MGKSRNFRKTNNRSKKVRKAKTQEELETSYHGNVVAFPSEGPMPVPRAGSELEHSWGHDFHPVVENVVDNLGRVNGKTYPAQDLDDNIPDFLRNPAVAKATSKAKSPENVQEHSVPEVKEKSNTITLMKDHTLEYPLLGFSVYVMGDPDVPNDEARFAKMFSRSYCKRARNAAEADLVVFAGGADVNPELYGENRHETTYFDTDRDEAESLIYEFCKAEGIPMLGICRGAQFLHVMNKGKLYQDVDGHMGPHTMRDIVNGIQLEKVSSVHHQMVMPNRANGMEIIGTSICSNTRAFAANAFEEGSHVDIEAFFYRSTGCVGIQGHPEYEGYNFFTVWCLKLLEDLISNNPDMDWVDGNLRMKKEIRTERDSLANLPEILLTELKGL